MTESTNRLARREGAAALGAAMRQAVLATIETSADVAVLDEAAELARRLTELLSTARRPHNQIADIDDFEAGLRMYGAVAGPASPLAPPAHFETTPTGLRGTVTLDRRFEGPPGHVHGGIITLLLDEAFGQAVTRAGKWGLTAYLNVTFHRASPLYTELELYADIDWDGGRKVFVEGGVRSPDEPEIVFATATGLFVEPREDRHAEYFGDVVDSAGAPASVRLGGRTGW